MSYCCAICCARSRGFGWRDPNKALKRQRFCSKRCQDIHYHYFTQGIIVTESEKNEFEKIAREAVINPLATYVCNVGSEKALFDYTKEEIHGLIHTIIHTYTTRLQNLYSDDIPF
ncbi:DUF6511 domain-containing protein [Agarilytica rhodophyticola]|uniref:DUF6511 domain-containing protein n=1 Tax=Agarilytica rhodophyticola TaxID=1737490 RepID=UPI000B34683D|nr:DUF6511 domain-containing protein [Agarilytica rhodophyticola]